MAPSIAADQLDQAVELILRKLRDGTAVPLPGIGVLEPGRAKVKLRSPQGRRKEVRSK